MQKLKTDEQKLAWLAGLLEGEACFGFRDTTRFIKLEMGDEDVVDFASDILHSLSGKAPNRYICDRPSRQNSSTMYRAELNGPAAELVMRLLVGYMSERRRYVILAALERRTLVQKVDLVALGLSVATPLDKS